MGVPTMKPIPTVNKLIAVKGKVFHNDRRTRIDLKKPIIDLFESAESEVGYIMELCLSQEKMEKRIKELSEQQIIPVLLYFVQGGDSNEDVS